MTTQDTPGTHIVAIGALVSPVWLHHLSDLSQTALPVLGAGWLLIQATVYVYRNFYLKPFWKTPK